MKMGKRVEFQEAEIQKVQRIGGQERMGFLKDILCSRQCKGTEGFELSKLYALILLLEKLTWLLCGEAGGSETTHRERKTSQGGVGVVRSRDRVVAVEKRQLQRLELFLWLLLTRLHDCMWGPLEGGGVKVSNRFLALHRMVIRN